jgi:D-serine deaminase-like pyridoxal phosphate-dependent protein
MDATGTLADLDTPFVAVDLTRVEHNIDRLQAYCDAHGLLNRPHVKTHKVPLIAHLQLSRGARGITVQTLGEAEVMVGAGIRDVLVTYDLIGPHKALRLARLARLADMSVALDNDLALATVSEGAARAERRIGVLIEFDHGRGRQGVLEPEAALALARRAHEDPWLEFLGLMTYPSSPSVAPWVARARELFGDAGIPIRVVSAGGTPGMWRAHEIAGLTEYRAGSSVYHDRNTVAAGSGDLDDCALSVHVTLVSMPTPDRGVIDAGSKVLTSDLVPPEVGRGYGLLLDYPDAVIASLSEEHGVVDFSGCASRPSLGDRLRVLPNHVCPVSNLVDEVVLHRDGVVEGVVPVAARGKR